MTLDVHYTLRRPLTSSGRSIEDRCHRLSLGPPSRASGGGGVGPRALGLGLRPAPGGIEGGGRRVVGQVTAAGCRLDAERYRLRRVIQERHRRRLRLPDHGECVSDPHTSWD